jgi:glycosyltransferase involved in cell wall biosynthesis
MLPPILLVIDDASIGGGQQHVLALAERLAGRGVEVAVACETGGYLVDELHRRSIAHHALQLPERPSLRALADTVRVIRGSRARLIHTHGGTAGFYGRLAARRVGGVRSVHTYHGIHYLHERNLRRRYLHRAIDRFLLRWTDEVICVAKSDRDLALMERLASPQHVCVVYNGIDVSRFAPGVRVNRDDGRFIVGTVGRLHEQKGHVYLLEAAEQIRQSHPQVRFRIIGDGPLRERLQADVRARRLDDIVDFLGARSDVPAQMQEFDLFVLPSLWEGLPYVLLEAMAAGLPIVATEVDGVREVITGGEEGLLVPPRNAQALAAAVLELAANGARRAQMGARGSRAVRERFSLEGMIEQTASVYSRAMTARC